MRLTFALLLLTFLATLCLSLPASAQWFSDSTTNTAVCTATATQDYPKACSDGADGVIVAWEDTRNGTGYRVYAQRMDKNGKALWKANGIALAPNGNISQRLPVLASDNNGGAYVVWLDGRNSASQATDLYCQHVSDSGKLLWDSAGRLLASGPNDQTNPAITADGYGNAFVVWEDNAVSSSTSQPDLGINKLTTSGPAWGGGTTVLTNQAGKQRRPTICEDGSGGCYVAWDNSADAPFSICANHVSGSGTHQWSNSSQPYGLQVFKAPSSTIPSDSKNVALRRDGNQLLMTWETTNGTSSADGQDVYANRLFSNGTKLYYTAPAVTGDYPGNETTPQIFSDDSVETGLFPDAGFYVIFQSSFISNHLGMVRFFANGIDQLPKSSGSIYSITSTANGTNGFSAVPISPGSAIVAWNDGRSDSSIYAQRVDRALARYFPAGSPSNWGLPIRVKPGTKATQVSLTPCTNGAIAVWCDWRNGNADIYSQVVFKDGSLPIELSSFNVTSPKTARPEVDLYWQTTSELNCAGFELQKRQIAEGLDNTWTFVADYNTTSSLRATGSSNTPRDYAFIDRDVQHGTYEYRLIDVSLDGAKKSHGTKLVEVGSSDILGWSFGPNVPNPVQSATSIPVTLSESAIVDITISDASGRIISHPVMNQLYPAGEHTIALTGSALPSSSGMYFVSMTAIDPITGGFIWHTPKPLEIAVMR